MQKVIRTLLMMVIAGAFVGGCGNARTRGLVAEAVARHSTVDDVQAWVETWDTEQFWLDVNILYADSLLNGNPEAFRALLFIDSYSDGAVAEGMPIFERVITIWPEMSRRVIMADERLLANCGRFLTEE
jgi:hypothetical protein